MTTRREWAVWALATAGVTLAWSVSTPVPGAARPVLGSAVPAQARMVFSHALPRMDGAHLEAKLVEVTYEPGGSSPPHRHPCAVVGYVVEGALRVRVNDGAEVIARAGESFYEAPNDLHAVSANASRTEPVKFLAYFTCDHDAPLVTPAPTNP